MFEGYYLNGKKGRGKGYIDNQLVYEIEEGKEFIKEYDSENNLIYEGEYSNGERNGLGKEYDIMRDCLIYEGYYINGDRNVKGKEYYEDGKIFYEGEFLAGKRHGKGKLYNYYKIYTVIYGYIIHKIYIDYQYSNHQN